MKNILAFFVALVLTACAILTLNAATRVSADTAAEEYTAQVQSQTAQVEQISANVSEEDTVSPILSIAAFAAILLVVAGLGVIFLKAKSSGKTAKRRYVPREDMSLRTHNLA